MQKTPYKIDSPALISFSGGRTSGYMLWHILDAFDGHLPPDIHVCFANTGKEMPQTLEFVAECAERWSVKINWLEYDPEAEGKTKLVEFTTASRDGEPFESIIRKRNFLPNPVTRFCTSELKIKRMIAFMRDFKGHKHWDNVVGLRADEQRRVAKQRARNQSGKERFDSVMPLVEAGVTKEMVVEWWDRQDFNLRLHNINGVTPIGNCDLCFMKGASTLAEIIRQYPERAEWWARMETIITSGKGSMAGRFRFDRPKYSKLMEAVQVQEFMAFPNEAEALPCYCTD